MVTISYERLRKQGIVDMHDNCKLILNLRKQLNILCLVHQKCFENPTQMAKTAKMEPLAEVKILYSKPVVSNNNLCRHIHHNFGDTFVRIEEICRVFFTIRNPFLNTCLWPHFNIFLPRVANGDKVGKHCSKLFFVRLYCSTYVFRMQQ